MGGVNAPGGLRQRGLPGPPSDDRWLRAVIIAVFFLSGAAGLVYEIVWTRALSLIFGVTTYAVATVLATFMAGLALGSYALGRWIDRRDNPLLVYAVLEAGVGLYALMVPTMFEGLRAAYVLFHQLDWFHLPVFLVRALLAGLVLIIPTTLMGGTYPILVRFFVRAPGEVGRAAGLLYFINTAGAVTGCLAAGFFLIERFGLRGATWCAVAASLSAAAVAAWLARRPGWGTVTPAVARTREVETEEVETESEAVPVRAWLVLACIGISGFTALAYEVLWFRALLRYLYNSTYAFTTMLVTFLAGLAIGSAVHAAFLRRRRRPLLVFAWLEVFVGIGFAVSTVLFAHVSSISALLLGDIVTSFGHSIVTMFLRSSFILLFPAIALGATVPLATEICARGLTGLGGTVGRVYAINTLGAIAGSLGAGFLLIPAIGMHGTLMLLVATNGALAVALALAEPNARGARPTTAIAFAALFLIVIAVMPRDVFIRTFGQPGANLIYYHEGATDTVAVSEAWGQRAILYDDQRGTSGTGAYRWNFFLGHLPLLLHPGEPRTVLHICFGVGNSLSAVTAHESVERVDNVELSPHVLDAAKFFWTNNDVLNNPKVRTIIDDGRNFVMSSRETYDVILLEPPEIFTAGVINLYTREFYRDAAARLAPGGIMMQWLPHAEAPLDEERMLFRAFYDVFPNATAWQLLEGGPILLIGSDRPLTIDYQKLKAKMQRERVQQDLELIEVDDVDHLLALFVFDAAAFRDFALPAQPVTDDRTVLDFSMPRYLGSGFGFGTFSPLVKQDGVGPFGAVFERARYYFEHRKSVVPSLTNLGESPEVVAARINAQARPNPTNAKPIGENAWRRWESEEAKAPGQ